MANALALANDNPLLALTQQESDITAQESLNYIGFFSKKSEAALEIQTDVKGIAEGEPFLKTKTGFLPITSIGLTGPTFHYWCELDTDYNVVAASLTDPGRGSNMKEHVLAPTIAYTPKGAFAALTTFRPTKAKAAFDIVNGIAGATDEKCKAAGPVGKELAKLPPALRVVGEADVIHKTSNAGFKYQLVRCRTRLLSDVECEALATALNDDEFNETVAKITESYTARKNMITKVAEETA